MILNRKYLWSKNFHRKSMNNDFLFLPNKRNLSNIFSKTEIFCFCLFSRHLFIVVKISNRPKLKHCIEFFFAVEIEQKDGLICPKDGVICPMDYYNNALAIFKMSSRIDNRKKKNFLNNMHTRFICVRINKSLFYIIWLMKVRKVITPSFRKT